MTWTREDQAAYSREWKRRNPEKVRASRRRQRKNWTPEERQRKSLWHFHRLTPEGLAAIAKAQGERCYLCCEPLPSDEVGKNGQRLTVIEHDHRCCPDSRSCIMCRRGVACAKCNLLIALANDDPVKLRRIASNLEAAIISLGLFGMEV